MKLVPNQPHGANAAPIVIPGPNRIAPPITRPTAGRPKTTIGSYSGT